MLEAIQCYKEDRNCATAYYELAIIYFGGTNGVDLDLEKGAENMSIAASMGLADANMELCHSSYLYWKNDRCNKEHPSWSKAGRIVMPYDPTKALLHLKAAASGCTCWTRHNCDLETTSVATGERDTHLKAQLMAQQELGEAYLEGDENLGVERSDELAVTCFTKPAAAGYVWSLLLLGSMYYFGGRGVPVDYSKSFELFQPAADGGSIDAMYYLGAMYDRGVGVEQDFGEALSWLQKAADVGHANAQCNLGAMYDNGRGVEKKSKEALMLFQKAADQGHVDAQFNLGVMYGDGRGVERDSE